LPGARVIGGAQDGGAFADGDEVGRGGLGTGEEEHPWCDIGGTGAHDQRGKKDGAKKARW
jgi:hypothetical protein